MKFLDKARAIDALANLTIELTSYPAASAQPWVASTHAEKKESPDAAVLCSVAGYGLTPEDAVDDLWDQLLNTGRDGFLVVNATDPLRRRHYRWNAFMWKEVPQ